MFPQVAILSGMFELVRSLGVYNTYQGLIMSYVVFSLPFTVWILTAFIRDLPIEIEEAAMVDGANSYVILFKVFLPLMWPAMVTTGILAFIGAWNEFLFALTFVQDEELKPISTILFAFSWRFINNQALVSAASIMMVAPVVILFLLFQKKFISGLTSGGVKG